MRHDAWRMNNAQTAATVRENFHRWRRSRNTRGDERKEKREAGVVARNEKPKRTYFPHDGFGVLDNGRLSEWVRLPDAKPPLTLRIARTAKESALTRISRQLPRKLPVILPKP